MSVQSSAQRDVDGDQGREQPFDFTKPIFNIQTAAAYCDSPSLAAFRMWVHRHSVPVGRCGRRLRFKRIDLDRAMGLAHRTVRSA